MSTKRLPNIILLEIAKHSPEVFDLFLTDSSFAKFMTDPHNRRQIYNTSGMLEPNLLIIETKCGRLHGQHIASKPDGSFTNMYFTHNGAIKAGQVYAITRTSQFTGVYMSLVDLEVYDLVSVMETIPTGDLNTDEYHKRTWSVIFDDAMPGSFYCRSHHPGGVTLIDNFTNAYEDHNVFFMNGRIMYAKAKISPAGKVRDVGFAKMTIVDRERLADHMQNVSRFMLEYRWIIEKYRPDFYKKPESSCVVM